jgi:hypothetical protein
MVVCILWSDILGSTDCSVGFVVYVAAGRPR